MEYVKNVNFTVELLKNSNDQECETFRIWFL